MLMPVVFAVCRFAIILTLCAHSVSLRAADAEKLSHAGLPNLHRIAPNLYRCAQPSADGFAAAEKLGIKTVINLRAFHNDKSIVVSTNLRLERIPFKTWRAQTEDMVRFLKIVANTNNGPFLVHCQHGADRTGTMVAVYRMAVQGWSKDAAINEMTKGGFGYHSVWKNLPKYIKSLDIAAVRRSAGLPDPSGFETATAKP
jgi:protein tyrosine/serine phosphatase